MRSGYEYQAMGEREMALVDDFNAQVLFSSSVLLSHLNLSGAKVYEPQIRALLGTALHFSEVGAHNLTAYGFTSLMRTPLLCDPTVAICLGTYGDPREVGVSYERGTPVGARLVLTVYYVPSLLDGGEHRYTPV